MNQTIHEQVATKHPNFCKIDPVDGVLEFYCDNQILSTIRQCEAHFVEAYLNNLAPRPRQGEKFIDGQENLDIGVWFHSIMEYVDKASIEGKDISTIDAIYYAKDLWIKLNIDGKYRDSKGYANIGGNIGALELVKDYMDFFNPSTDSFKIIATEMIFGYDKEVPIKIATNFISDEIDQNNSKCYPYRAYLVGRPDGIIESQLGVGPKDFKTSSRMSTIRESYKPSEQLIGYTYAINKILGSKLAPLGKKCNTAYLIAVNKMKPKEPKDRVKKIPYTYSDGDLEQYRLRQVATFDRLYELLVLNQTATWNTFACSNWYHKKCHFHDLHSSVIEQRESKIQSDYMHKIPWNPRTRNKDEETE